MGQRAARQGGELKSDSVFPTAFGNDLGEPSAQRTSRPTGRSQSAYGPILVPKTLPKQLKKTAEMVQTNFMTYFTKWTVSAGIIAKWS